MTSQRKSIHGQWSSRWAFILAATGSAVGLGNIWKFPYIAGEYGGGAFVLVYLGCIALVGVPIMAAEIMLGRRGRQSPINTMRTLAEEGDHSPHWQWLGWAGVITGFLILSFYAVIAGWALAYVFRLGGGILTGADATRVAQTFSELTGDGERVLAWYTIFLVMTLIVVSRGVRNGLEQAVKFLMPALFVLLLILVGYAMNEGAFLRGVHFLFDPDFSKLDAEGVLVAMGHAFFTLSLGMGAIMVYGSYLSDRASILKTTFAIAGMDTLVALLAGLAIFPIVFAHGLEPGSGPGLLFQTLPIAFSEMPWGGFFGMLFFILVVFAAWTSSISLIEPAVTWLVENHGMSRVKAATGVGLAVWFFGLGSVLSFNLWGDAKFLMGTWFDNIDFLTANILLPLGGLFIALFAGWMMPRAASQDELGHDGAAYALWRFVLRYITPLGVLTVFVYNLYSALA